MAKWKSDSCTQKYRRPRNQQYCFDQDSRPGSPLQVSRQSFGTKWSGWLSIWIFKFHGSFRVSTTRATTTNRRTNNTFKKYQPTKALQWHATCRKKKTMENLIEATILTGPFEGEAVLIPRIPMIPTDLPFQFKRLQLPIRLAFAITINKAQGQSLEKCGIDRNTDCFSHGQLYVACSRVGKPDNLFICSDNWTAIFVLYLSIYLSI